MAKDLRSTARERDRAGEEESKRDDSAAENNLAAFSRM